ncbi:MAG: GNAT family N-acetyltransferase [Chloroflexi bacterium]|nr:GNAT family N-acetyltransferase [Chloroflexota bacterium]MCI0579561.1 GNAT family N-acetyltransferase [Chloroflexota bacterium]MCI0646802.1 GNAT family N-acetyltransferase [Chloroflexota bacterium]MCI0727472.1 GNAT family N-acetyltransferase [Chloroflexota bacterium]
MKLVPADQFTIEQLTEAYNQTREDYIVPMPMNVARLREYIHVYDVALNASCVAVEGDDVFGLGMLAVREGRGWITRLGVLPTGRRRGTGQALMDGLLAGAAARRLKTIWLEVIQGNEPAYHLFVNNGFTETRELVVARRPPDPHFAWLQPGQRPESWPRTTTLSHEEALILLAHRRDRPNWLNETESMRNVRNLTALVVEFQDGSRGWVSYHASIIQLTRINVEVTTGRPDQVAAAVLALMHQRHSSQDAILENLPAADPKWPGFQQAGYFATFRRTEMVKEL